jgi:hypothetical protein
MRFFNSLFYTRRSHLCTSYIFQKNRFGMAVLGWNCLVGLELHPFFGQPSLNIIFKNIVQRIQKGVETRLFRAVLVNWKPTRFLFEF